MTTTPMSSTDKVRSYLRNRAGEPVTNEAIAIGTKLKLGTVGPIIARLIDGGEVARTAMKKQNRAGREMTTVVLADFFTETTTVRQRVKPMPRRGLMHHADLLEEAANRVLTVDVTTGVEQTMDALQLLRIARDSWRAMKNQYLPESERVVVKTGKRVGT